jgi:hypothetical protein
MFHMKGSLFFFQFCELKFSAKLLLFSFLLEFALGFPKKKFKRITKLWKSFPKKINNNNPTLIQLFISKILPNYVVLNFTMETKVKYIDLASLQKMILKICCNIFFKDVELIICVSVWLMFLNKYGLENWMVTWLRSR